MERNIRETLRYLGYKNQTADPAVMKLAEGCWDDLERAASPRSFYREYELALEGECIDAGVFRTESHSLARNLKDCGKVILLAASLGTAVDMLIQRYSKLQMSRAVVLQAAAAACLEDYCDAVNEKLKEDYGKMGLYLRPRFSPGYGDFPLECQKAILESLEASKRVGITLTDSFLMAPSKSVTAVIGVSRLPGNCTVKGCEACGKTDCVYRR